jgi:two-component system, cell cycle sensor histidine kinase and response regulator CckA
VPPAFTARQRTLVVSTLVAVLTAVATVWAHWLNPLMNVGVMPATGVALAALLILEPRHWVFPLVATGAAVAGVGLLYDLDLAAAAAPAVAAVVGAVVGACCLRAYARGPFTLRRVSDVAALAVLGAGVGAFVGAAAGVAVAELGHQAGNYLTVTSRVGLANALGIIIVSTALLSWAARPSPPLPGHSTEALILGASVVVAGVLAFRVWSDPLAYAIVLLLVWAAIRFRVRGVSTAALVMAAIADWSIARGTGPLVDIGQSPRATLLILQTFVAVSLLALLFLAAALDERDFADAHRRIATDQFRRTFDTTPIGMALTTLDGVIVDANSALCEMFGCPRKELIGTTLEGRHYPDDRSGEHELSQFLPGAAQYLGTEQRYIAANDEIVWVEVSEARVRGLDGNPDSGIVSLHDITRRKGLEEQLLHAQKMEAVGRLAGDVAHDFNNLLAVMRGHAELLDDDLRVLGQARTRLASMQRATAKAAALTEDLLTYSRRRTDDPEIIDLHEVITAAQEMLLQLVGDGIELDVQLDATTTSVHADPFRIEQALVNIVMNGSDAMPEGGTLTIATSNPVAPDRSGRSVELTVTDTGTGMTTDVQRRIFEPFFTTKPPGSGTGLGLSTAYGVVRNCGGNIAVESELGKGTTFVITLPISTVAVDVEEADPELTGPTIDLRPATILVVDDEPEVRAVVIAMLRDSGYRVLDAADAGSALDLITNSDIAVDLVVSDVVMPGIGGPELAEQIHARAPGMPVVFVSGYADIAPTAPGLRGATLLRKPLDRNELVAEIEVALSNRARQRG